MTQNVFDPEGPPAAPDARDEDGEPVLRSTKARIRRAATLILIDRTAHGPKVLMGRRSAGHVFMPDKWVFPGGRAERADAFAPSASELSPQVTALLAAARPATGPRTLRGLAQAAIRELREEAGLRLEAIAHPPYAQCGEVAAKRSEGPRASADDAGARVAPLAGASGPLPGFAGTPPSAMGKMTAPTPLPDLAALELIGRAITPPYRVRRFDALFFTASADRLLARERDTGDGELDEIAWFTLPEALALDLPNVTSFMLKELGHRMERAGRPPLYLRYMHRKHTVLPMGAAA